MQMDPEPAGSVPDPPSRFHVMALWLRVQGVAIGTDERGMTSLWFVPVQTHCPEGVGDGVRVGAGVTRGLGVGGSGGGVLREEGKQFRRMGALEHSSTSVRRLPFLQKLQAASWQICGCWLIQRLVKQWPESYA